MDEGLQLFPLQSELDQLVSGACVQQNGFGQRIIEAESIGDMFITG